MHDKQYSRSETYPKVGSIEREGWDNLGIFSIFKDPEKKEKVESNTQKVQVPHHPPCHLYLPTTTATEFFYLKPHFWNFTDIFQKKISTADVLSP
jgi:hypothetical protein